MDKIKGGLADNVPDGKFNLVSLLKGIKVEMEHTSDKEVAKEIAKDHLSEDPLYYQKLKSLNLESILKEASPFSEFIGKELSDEYEITGIKTDEDGNIKISLYNLYSGKNQDYIEYNREEKKFYINQLGTRLSIPDEYHSFNIQSHNLLNAIISKSTPKIEKLNNSADTSSYRGYLKHIPSDAVTYYRIFPKDSHLENKIKLQFRKLKRIAEKNKWNLEREVIHTKKHDFLIHFKKGDESLRYIPFVEDKTGEGQNDFTTVHRIFYNERWWEFNDVDKCFGMAEYILSGKEKKENVNNKNEDIIKSLLRIVKDHLKKDGDVKSLYNIAVRATEEGDETSVAGLVKTISNKLLQKEDVKIEIPKKKKSEIVYIEKIVQFLLNKDK